MSKKSDKLTFICIQCPVGCTIHIGGDNSTLTLTGNGCPRGYEYVMQEISDPRRMLTITVKVKGGRQPLVAVKSEHEVPKQLVKKCVQELSKIVVEAPVACGDMIYRNVCKTGIDIVATGTVEEAS